MADGGMLCMLKFDIGCNIGQWIESNLQDSKIIGVEANPFIAGRVYQRFKDNTQVTIINALVGAVDSKELDFYVEQYDPLGVASTACKEWVTGSRFTGICSWSAIRMKTITLDSLIDQYGLPDHIKIDVEGYELEVLLGLTQVVDLISFEWAEEQKQKVIDSVNYLVSMGYTKFAVLLNHDTYDYIPAGYTDYKTIIDWLKLLVVERKEKWGMIYAHI